MTGFSGIRLLYSRLVTILKGMKNLLAKTHKGLSSKKLIVEIRASNKKYTDRKTRYTVQEWIEAKSDPRTTSEKNDSTKEFGGTPDKEEGNRVRTALQETPEPDCRNKEKRPCDATESNPMKKIKDSCTSV